MEDFVLGGWLIHKKPRKINSKVCSYSGFPLGEVPIEIVEQMLIRLDVVDVAQCKTVCKSWKSLISSSSFIKSHVNHSSNTDRNNESFRDRRVVFHSHFYERYENYDNVDFEASHYHLLGSSNGLVFVSTPAFADYFVANPITKELKKLQNPQMPPDVIASASCCWGFGYDSSTDDYKVVLGFIRTNGEEDSTCFQVLSLKSNVWKVLGEVKYKIISKMGALCNGVLHWFMNDQNQYGYYYKKNPKVIVSFDLSDEEFGEIPQPDHARYECRDDSRLGIMKECLCIYGYDQQRARDMWVLTNYNLKKKKHSWEQPPYLTDKRDKDPDSVNLLVTRRQKFSEKVKISLHPNLLTKNNLYVGCPIFVETLVSPHS